jgi:hypothetical protein
MIKEPTFNTVNNNDIIDLDLSITRKKKLRFGKDDNRIVEVNTSDMNLMQRVNVAYPKLQELQAKSTKLTDGIEIEEGAEADAIQSIATMAERLTVVDTEMRDLIDYIFDAPVSTAAAPDGSMYDPFNGSFRYEHIIAVMMEQYENNLQSEFKKMEKQLKKHTDKYTRR